MQTLKTICLGGVWEMSSQDLIAGNNYFFMEKINNNGRNADKIRRAIPQPLR